VNAVVPVVATANDGVVADGLVGVRALSEHAARTMNGIAASIEHTRGVQARVACRAKRNIDLLPQM
jgi:hypothetical protein